MAKGSASIGGSIGGLLGMMGAMAIPIGGESFFSRLTGTGNVALTSDPIVTMIGVGYILLGVLIGGAIGALIGNMAGS